MSLHIQIIKFVVKSKIVKSVQVGILAVLLSGRTLEIAQATALLLIFDALKSFIQLVHLLHKFLIFIQQTEPHARLPQLNDQWLLQAMTLQALILNESLNVLHQFMLLASVNLIRLFVTFLQFLEVLLGLR